MSDYTYDECHTTAYYIKTVSLGAVALLIAVVLSWYVPLIFFSDFECHYPNGDTSVRITYTGEKYHIPSCSYLHSSSIKITLEKACERGYGACSRCNPPVFVSIEDYQLAKEKQPLPLLFIGIPLLCVIIAFFSLMLVARIYDFFGVFDIFPEWFSILLACAIYVTTLIQGFRMLIIW